MHSDIASSGDHRHGHRGHSLRDCGEFHPFWYHQNLVALKDHYGGFLKWGYPQITHFSGIFYYKPSILGIPHFWKPLYRPREEAQIWFGLSEHLESGVSKPPTPMISLGVSPISPSQFQFHKRRGPLPTSYIDK